MLKKFNFSFVTKIKNYLISFSIERIETNNINK